MFFKPLGHRNDLPSHKYAESIWHELKYLISTASLLNIIDIKIKKTVFDMVGV